MNMIGKKISLAQARRDLQYMLDTYDYPQDFCGSFCNAELLESILMGRTNVKDAVINNISYYFRNGISSDYCHSCSSNIKPNMDDPRIQRIVERYDIDTEW